MARFGIDAPTLLHLVASDVVVSPEHRLVAPQTLRRHEVLTGIKVRLLGDRVSRRVAWRIARERGLSTVDAEYLAVTSLQVDLFVSVDPAARARADGVVPLGSVDQLSG